MFKEYTCITRGGTGEKNEDAVWCDGKSAFVIDGSTGLTSAKYMDGASDAEWFSGETKSILSGKINDTSRPIKDILEETMDEVASLWKGEICESPSASISIVRENQGMMEYYGLGDCSFSVETVNGFTAEVEKEVVALDNIALSEMVRLYHQGMSMEEARKSINDILIRHRNLANKQYWILDMSKKGIAHGRERQFPISDCKSVLMYSDGFGIFADFKGLDGADELHRFLHNTEDFESVVEQVYSLREEDKDWIIVPRFKMHDDTTVFFGRF